MSKWPQLPPELLSAILDYAYPPVRRTNGPQDPSVSSRNDMLATCALVCKRWAATTQYTLWRRINVDSNRLQCVLDILETIAERGSGLPNVVDSFEASLWRPGALAQLPSALALCYNLTTVTLYLAAGVFPPRSDLMRRFDVKALDELRKCTRVTHLVLNAHCDGSAVLAQLLNAWWPSLKHLEYSSEVAGRIPFPLPSGLSLRSLSFKVNDPNLFTPFLSHPLVELETDEYAPSSAELALLKSTLKSLRMRHNAHMQHLDLSMLEKLDTLELARPELVTNWPPNVRRIIAQCGDREDRATALGRALRDCTELKELAVPWSKTRARDLLRRIEMACKRAGVEMVGIEAVDDGDE